MRSVSSRVSLSRPLVGLSSSLPRLSPFRSTSSPFSFPSSSSSVGLAGGNVKWSSSKAFTGTGSGIDNSKWNGGPNKPYNGPLKLAVLDWSGTMADNYVIAPAYAFVEVFEKAGVPITMSEARIPMGLRKDLHIKALTEIPAIRKRWQDKFGRAPDDKDVAKMFEDFIPAQLRCLPRFTGLIPGAKEAVDKLRSQHNLLIGNTTGFQRVMVDVLLAAAIKQGYKPDVTVAGDDVDVPRPWPMMVYRNMQLLKVAPVHAVVKVDDTVGGVGEGLNAGAWTIALYETSNYMDIDTMEQRKAMSDTEFRKRAEQSKQILIGSGAHYVVPDITFVPDIITDINRRLKSGERP